MGDRTAARCRSSRRPPLGRGVRDVNYVASIEHRKINKQVHLVTETIHLRQAFSADIDLIESYARQLDYPQPQPVSGLMTISFEQSSPLQGGNVAIDRTLIEREPPREVRERQTRRLHREAGKDQRGAVDRLTPRPDAIEFSHTRHHHLMRSASILSLFDNNYHLLTLTHHSARVRLPYLQDTLRREVLYCDQPTPPIACHCRLRSLTITTFRLMIAIAAPTKVAVRLT